MNGDVDEKTIFENFKRKWKDGSLDENDPIMKMVRSLSNAARRRGWEDWTEDIENEVLWNIHDCNYSGEGSLEGYIRISIKNTVTNLFRQEHQSKRDEMPDEVSFEVDFDRPIAEKESADKVRLILSRVPENFLWYIEAILGAEKFMGEKTIATTCKTTRHQVTKAKKEIRKIMEDIEKQIEKEPDNKSHTAKFK